jgi:hypothetical protein
MRCTGVADLGNANHALLCQNLLRAANDGYDVSTLIDHGADPMTSGTFCQPSPNLHTAQGDSGAPKGRPQRAAHGLGAHPRHLRTCSSRACPAPASAPRARGSIARGDTCMEQQLARPGDGAAERSQLSAPAHHRRRARRACARGGSVDACASVLVQSPPWESVPQDMLSRVCVCVWVGECVWCARACTAALC